MMRNCIYLLFAVFAFQAPIHGSKVKDSPRIFVQGFYDWYVPVALKTNAGPGFEIAIKSKGTGFSPHLAKALKEDSEAQAKVTELVGIDFDPFLNSQDPKTQYLVGKIIQEGKKYLVAIHGVRDGKKKQKPDLVAEVTRKGNQWVFVNFRYPKKRLDLLSLLKLLRTSRQSASEQ